MSFNFNHSTLVGRLTRDPETRSIAETEKTTFTLAVKRAYKKADGSQETDFIQIALWGKLAEISQKYLRKGTPVLVEGRLQIRSYEKEKQKHWQTEVVGDNFQILETLEKKEANN